MMKKAFVVTGLGYGDEGKGTVTHWLSFRHHAHTVIRTGGAQAFHRVVRNDGKEHIFSQFGGGTLQGAATHLSEAMVIDPHAILKEGEALRDEHGICDVFDKMTIHEGALVITPFQAIAGRLRELLRGTKRRGSVGIGIGETVQDGDALGGLAVRAWDLKNQDLRKKLEAMQNLKWKEFEKFADRACDVPLDVRSRVKSELADLEAHDTVEWAVERFNELVKRVRIVDTDYVARHILGRDGAVIFENSQGVLLDRFYGFHPYVTKVRTVPEIALGILKECGYDGDVKSYGILRAYHTRHGSGPFVSESAELTAMLPDEANKEHAWQGKFRVGYFDALMGRYALESCDRRNIDGVVLTCADRIRPMNFWEICNSYSFSGDIATANPFFRLSSNTVTDIISAKHEFTGAQIKRRNERQKKICKLLTQCSPDVTAVSLAAHKQDKRINFLADALEPILNIPIVAVSVGPTEADKIEIKNGQ